MSHEEVNDEQLQDTDRAPLQVDVYGIKLRPHPTPATEPTPKTWQELRTAVATKLRSIVLNLVGVADDTVKSLRSIVRGIGAIGTMPDAVARRIGRAHAIVDGREDQKAEEAKTTPTHQLSPLAMDKTERLIRQLETRGVPARRITLPSGLEAIAVAPPPLLQDAKEAIEAEIKLLTYDLAPPSEPSLSSTTRTPVAIDSPLATLKLPSRIKKALTHAGVNTIDILRTKSDEDLKRIPGLGPKSRTRIHEALAQHPSTSTGTSPVS